MKAGAGKPFKAVAVLLLTSLGSQLHEIVSLSLAFSSEEAVKFHLHTQKVFE